MNFFRKFGRPSRRSRRCQLLGGGIGALLFVAITWGTLSYDHLNKPSFISLTLIFWVYSGAPIIGPASLILGKNSGAIHLGLLPCAVGMWIATGILVGTLVGIRFRDRGPSPAEPGRMEERRANHWYRWAGIVIILTLLFWPTRIPVSGTTIVSIVHPDGSPFVGVPVQEKWYVEGYDEGGDQEERLTDAAGRVEFPPRVVQGWLGWRTAKRFLADNSAYSTRRWGPFLYFKIRMPAGYWVPRDHGESIENDLTVTYQDLGASRYLTIMNLDPSQPDVFITSREHGAFAGDLRLNLTLRQASRDEIRLLDASPRRQQMLAARKQSPR